MTNSIDDNFIGDFILSFSMTILKPAAEIGFQDKTVGFVFAIAGKENRVVKFPPDLAHKLRKRLKATLVTFPEADQTAAFEEMTRTRPKEAQAHPLGMFFDFMPPALQDPSRSLEAQYVNVIHLNTYNALVKLDLSFYDGSTSRFSMASSVAVLFLHLLDNACPAL